MSAKNESRAKEYFQEGMVEFVGQNYDKSIEVLNRAIESDSTFKLARLSRATAYMKLDRLDEARVDFDRVIEIDPNYSKAYHMRGLVYERSGDQEAALIDFNKAIDLDPEYGAAYYSRANLHANMGNQDLATEDIQMVTHLTNVNIESFANENNIWRSQHLKLEETGDLTDPMDR